MSGWRIGSVSWVGLCVLFCLSALSLAGEAAAQECQEQYRTSGEVVVWANPPEYVPSKGWVGAMQEKLPAGVKVFKCSEQNVGFPGSTYVFFRIAYWKVDKFLFGWVGNENLLKASLGLPNSGHGGLMLATGALSSVMMADIIIGQATGDTSAAAVYEPPSGMAPKIPELEYNIGGARMEVQFMAGDRAPYVFYGICFFVMILGMISKAIVDTLTSNESFSGKKLAVKILIPLFISPMAFGTAMQSIESGIVGNTGSVNGLILIIAASFQNGFFWQSAMEAAGRAQQALGSSRGSGASGGR